MKGKSKLLALALALMMLCSVVVSPLMSVTAAVADLADGGNYMIVSAKNGKAMTVAGYSLEDNAQIVMMPANRYASQVWRLDKTDDGYFVFVNAHSGKAMNVPNNSVEQGTQMIQWNNDGGNNEKWEITDTDDGYYRIRPNLVEGFGLNIEGNSDADGAAVIQWPYGGANNEKWDFVPVDEVLPNPEPEAPNAKAAVDAWLEMFYSADTGAFSNVSGFWAKAEILEVVIDAYERLGDEKYKTIISQNFDKFLNDEGANWSWNGYNDDIMWMVIASTRAYLLTGEQKYLTAAKENFDMCYARAWDTSFMNGGLWWTTDNNSKNACVNGPGAIAACLLGDATGDASYYTKAQEIIDWEAANFLQDSGAIYDSFNVNDTYNAWASTYNQGTFIGACAMLYNYTDDAKYLEWATSAAGYAATMGNPMNREQNNADLIGFKGILGRWLGYFARECGVETYNDWMYANATAAWNNRNSDNLMWTQFGVLTEENLQNSETIFDTDNNKTISEYAAWGSSSPVSWLINTPARAWTVTSPDGNTVMEISLDAAGALGYTATQDGVTVVEESEMGINTSLGNFTTGLTFESATTAVIDETYNVISGKADTYENKANETTLTFTSASGVQFDVVARAYDDGIAFRYVITTENGQNMTIQPNAESTTFNLPNGSQMWYMPRTDNSFMYENDYLTGTVGTVAEGTRPSMPMLYEVGDKYGLIMEADRHGNYVGSLLEMEADGVLRTIFDPVQDAAVNTTAPFTSPWRTVVIGSAADIMQNTMVENLSPAPDEETYDYESWVAPGMSSWSWVSYYGGQEDPDIHKKFIDLAADMGWEYYILDEKWQPGSNTAGSYYEGMWDWFPEVRDYANERGVKLFAWVHMNDVNTDAEREARFAEWSAAGIVGIKVDFFYNESQSVLQLHDDIYADAAKYKLMVNVHGSNPSSGEIRTYPNVITREAIKGQEQGGITVDQYTLIPFLRAAVGSADVTEQLYSRDTGKTTMGFQIALSTLIQNGLHSMGSKPEEYYSIPAAVSYYTNFPVTWDDMYVMEDITAVGEQVNLARKSGDAWYAAGISVDAANYTITPAFLDANKTYTAVIYKEVAGERQNIEMQVVSDVTATTVLPTIAVQAGGGYAIKFVPTDDDLTSLTATPTDLILDVLDTQEVKITVDPTDTIATDVVWAVADESIAMISSMTGKSATIKGLMPGKTTVTATSAYDANIKAVFNVTVQDGKYIFDDATWTVFENNYNYVINSEASVTITAENGVIDNNIFALEATDDDFEITAKISGGLNANYQGGFIGVFNADRNPYVSVGRRYHTMFDSGGDTPHNHISVMSNTPEQYTADPNAAGDVYVRLVKEGNNFTGYYRVNEADEWTLAYTVTNADLSAADPLYVGFYAGCGGSTNGIDITISEFTYKAAGAAESTPIKVAAVNPDYIPASEKIEAEDAVLANGAAVATNAEASNGAHAGNIGANAGAGSATFTVNSPYAGTATVKAYYITWGNRDLALSVNGGEAKVITCPGNGINWTTPLATPVEFTVDLVAGENILVFSGNGGDAPNLDYIEIIYPEAPVEPEPEPVNPGDLAVGNSYEMELATVTGGEIVTNNGASNGADVGNVGGANNGTVTFELESAVTGTATLAIYYGTLYNRSVSVTVNGTAYNINCPATGGWHVIGAPVTVEVDVVAGTNTIVFGGVDGGDAPNLDRFVVTALVEDIPDPVVPTENAVFRAEPVQAAVNSTVRVPLYIDNADALLGLDAANGTLAGFEINVGYDQAQLSLTGFTPADAFATYDITAGDLEVSGGGKILAYYDTTDSLVQIADLGESELIGYMHFTTTADFVTTTLSFDVERVCDSGSVEAIVPVEYTPYVESETFEIEKLDIDPLKFASRSLTLYSSLTVNFKANKALFETVGYTDPYVIFEFNGEKVVVTEYREEGNYYVFDFNGVIPHQMNDTIYATLYANYDDVLCFSTTIEYSVATYCYNTIARYNATDFSGAAYDELRTLVVDLLNYGAKSQVYMNYNVDELVNAQLTDEQAAWATSEERTLETVQTGKYETVENPTVTWAALGLNLEESVGMRFKFNATSIEGLTVKVKAAGSEWTVPSDEFLAANGGYYVFVDELNAGQMSVPVYVTVYDGDTAVSNTVRYSIESYAYSKQNDSNTALAELVKAMMKYGDSAYAYVN